MTRLLVTGGAGFIGGAVVTEALARGWEVRVLDSLRPDVHGAAPTLDPRVELVVGDVRDRETVDAALQGIDIVDHQAAKVGLGVDFADAPDYVDSNVTGTAVLLAGMTDAGLKHLVVASSMVVYGEGAYRDAEGPVRPGPRSVADLDAGRFDPLGVDGEPLHPELIDEDAPRARESVTRLANMLRYSLQSGQLETVPFDDELRIVEDYLALEQIRHENRLQVRWDIAEAVRTGSVTVPPMLLQTLVENAVKYGIGTRREGGELRISARYEGAALCIRVTNPGDLSAPASASAARAGSSTGVGLRNASERLKLLFGDRASLTLLSEPPGCVTASVLIPLNPPVK